MRYGILLFVVVVLLAGCNGKHGGVQTTLANDSLRKTPSTSFTSDSVSSPELRKLLLDDSIQLLEVKHEQSGEYLAEQLLYIDHKVSTNFKYQGNPMQIKANDYRSIGNDSLSHIHNPYSDLVGQYLSVNRYKGKIVFMEYSDGGTSTSVMTDTCLWTSGQTEWSGERYVSAGRNTNGITKYDFSSDGYYYLEIKRLGGEFDLQLWKRTDGEAKYYTLMVPMTKSLFIPNLFAVNNLGAGSDMSVEFDQINYDSLMNGK